MRRVVIETEQFDILVYVVDDETDTLEIYEDSLTLNFNIITFSRSKDALDALHKQAPDVLVTDLNMPEMGGVQLVSKNERDNQKLTHRNY